MYKNIRLAVLLAGDFRSFPRAAPYIFKYANKISAQVDYYFATWNVTSDTWHNPSLSKNTERPITETDIVEPFRIHNSNLVNFKLLPLFDPTKLLYTKPVCYLQGYLGKVAAILKRQHELENNFIYDMVIELRPDVLIVASKTSIVTPPQDFEINLEHQFGNLHFPGATDFYYRSNSIGNDIMSNRFTYDKLIEGNKLAEFFDSWPMPLTPHWFLLDYTYLRRLKINGFPFPERLIPIRPNFPYIDLENCPKELLKKLFDDYWNMTRI